MEYIRDLLKNSDKSIFRLVLGIFFCLISIVWIIARWTENESISVLDWLYSGILSLSGLTHMMAGPGIPIERFFGKAFVHIDNEMIDMKPGVFEKEYKIDWQEIKSIEYKLVDLTVYKLDNSSITLPLSKLDYLNVIGI